MGRVLLWMLLMFCAWYWFFWPDRPFPASLENSMAFALAYNLGGKAVNTFGPRGHRRVDHDDHDEN